jgi:hypothetical protein
MMRGEVVRDNNSSGGNKWGRNQGSGSRPNWKDSKLVALGSGRNNNEVELDEQSASRLKTPSLEKKGGVPQNLSFEQEDRSVEENTNMELVKVGDLGKETKVGGRSNKILEKRSGENLQLKETRREEREAKQTVDDQEENLVNMEVTEVAMEIFHQALEDCELHDLGFVGVLSLGGTIII